MMWIFGGLPKARAGIDKLKYRSQKKKKNLAKAFPAHLEVRESRFPAMNLNFKIDLSSHMMFKTERIYYDDLSSRF